jgi:hypothetical protein
MIIVALSSTASEKIKVLKSFAGFNRQSGKNESSTGIFQISQFNHIACINYSDLIARFMSPGFHNDIPEMQIFVEKS